MVFQLRNLQFYLKVLRRASSATPSVVRGSCVCTQVPQFNQDGTHRDWRSKCNRCFLVGIVPLVYYIYRNHADLLTPTVLAASESSVRKQHNFIADVVERAIGAVVCIELIDSDRLDFFATGVYPTSNGSGFIIEENGMILTNAHVILAHPRSRIQVKLPDGDIYTAHVDYVDVNTDLALIHIKAKTKLPTLKLGTSKDLRPGEFVIAMGSPLNLTNTVTSGIVSATNRKSSELNLMGPDMSYIQTDAAITFGNSGGPLINLDGEVVGINAIRLAQSSGISFAIPADYVNEFLERAKSKAGNAKVRGMGKRYLGVTMMTLKPEVMRELRSRYSHIPPEITGGALIWKVVVGSPAYKSGVLPGDIVTEINGSRVTSSSSIYDALEKYNVLQLVIFRDGNYIEVVVHPENIF